MLIWWGQTYPHHVSFKANRVDGGPFVALLRWMKENYPDLKRGQSITAHAEGDFYIEEEFGNGIMSFKDANVAMHFKLGFVGS